MLGFVQKGGLWVIAQNLLTTGVLVLGPLTGRGDWPAGWRVIGSGLFLVGAVFGVTGVRDLGRNRTPYPQPTADHRLVESGVYRVVRHPLYSSLIFLSFGWSLAWSSGWTLALAALLTVVLEQKSRVEERWLRGKYPGYAGYARKVSRLIPWIY